MNPKMPRGAIPSPRSELAASNPYRPEPGAEIFVPSGAFPSPNNELASAEPYAASGAAPESFLAWPIEIGFWGNDSSNTHSSWAEEAFAKACAEPKVFIPADVVERAAQDCGLSNFARFMQTRGFQVGRTAYLDGPFNKVDWTNTATLNGAIANVGPVKIGIASAGFASSAHGPITRGTSGWIIRGVPTGEPENYCASLCGYGSFTALAGLFDRYGIDVDVPPDVPFGLCYAMFMAGSIGIVDQQSLINVTGEAWVRNPTTIVKNLDR